MKTIKLFELFLCLTLTFKSTQSYTPLKLKTEFGFYFPITVFSNKQKLLRSPTELHVAATTISDESNINAQEKHRKISIPESLRKLSFLQQAVIVLAYYFMHVTYLSQIVVALPFELSPSGINSVGLDSLVGMLCMILALYYCSFNKHPVSIASIIDPNEVPWRRPRQHPAQSATLIALIFFVYSVSGALTPAITIFLNITANFIPLTIPIQRNLLVVIAHFLWVIPASLILRTVEGFYGKVGGNKTKEIKEDSFMSSTTAEKTVNEIDDRVENGKKFQDLEEITAETTSISGDFKDNFIDDTGVMSSMIASKPKRKGIKRFGRVEYPNFWKQKEKGTSDWMTLKADKSNWVWWVVGGYSVSVFLFKLADWFNGNVVPLRWFEMETGNIVNQMIAPEGNDVVALLIGAVAPCISAPLWEEIFYRGLIYPWLCSLFPMPLATPLSAIIFAAHHARKDVFIPLFTLGLIWACLYVLSGNLFVPVVVHAMWNSRVFLGSFLGY
jgi:membrane protease YdiL (CAAX protease family)